jgi:hypothetical protein
VTEGRRKLCHEEELRNFVLYLPYWDGKCSMVRWDTIQRAQVRRQLYVSFSVIYFQVKALIVFKNIYVILYGVSAFARKNSHPRIWIANLL